MRATFTIVAMLALTMVAPRAYSQVKLGFAAGPGWATDGTGKPSGTHFALSATLRPSTSLFSYRLETLLDGAAQAMSSTGATSAEHRHATFALTLSAVRRFSKRAQGPYLIAGVGLYHQWNETVQGDERTNLWSKLGPGASAGIGVNFPVRGQEMFIETRYHTTGFESRVPVSLGIRI
jgi:hypothetical protein